ncbi:helix-turn-helix domain-containing protein [Paenibacillus tyrfis]|uniref:helix-turn-helix domain-containing protein n=1 Tax=Paenibacillus tyrfis TaxID=1501230 RepID=UPI00209F8828|nr:helix-turn-helix domain-containing protein [Paenibacillus tyrfis]MCP1310333.1 helix-turn-helix domain-containing protein [Paenibacillus tyrfis]
MRQNPTQATFTHLLISGTLVHEATFAEMQAEFDMYLRPNLAMVFSMDRYPDLALGQPIQWRVDIGHKLIDALHAGIQAPFVWVWVAEGVLALLVELGTKDRRDPDPAKTAFAMAKQVQKLTDVQGFSVSVGIGTFYDNPYMLHYSYEEAKESMIDRFFQGNRLIFQYEKQKQDGEQPHKPVSQAERTELMARVRLGDVHGAVSYLHLLLERMGQTYRGNVDMFKSEVIDLVMQLTRLSLDVGGHAQSILSENARFIQDLYMTIRYDKFVAKVSEHWSKLTARIGEAQTAEVSPVIRTAIAYMKQHHQRKIPLEEIAQYCYLSTYHFSHLFRKETGSTFVDYLNKLRIEKAVYYLENTDKSVQEIASLAGFQDSNYFSRLFKRYLRCSPNEYRAAKLC